MAKKSKKGDPENLIASNRKANHDYFIEAKYEAGLVLKGWEVKSLRAKHCQLKESYISIKDGEAWLIGAHISALSSAVTHIVPNPVRARKLLLHDHELRRLTGKIKEQGYALVPISMYWSKGNAKCLIGLAKGKKQHDKRATEKEKDFQRSKQRGFKDNG